ncbi:nucleoside-diphosphate sugar epimerase [Candidatus Woesearchaeota archaeon]|nr:nucleoside-diphosphate sugar epimerase [Candidatus Woesearchaeota archaeon]|tara:strand:- start:10065 stop:11102 length:1038 start_codon:yes stop_codon:yes gene_type:complete
MRALITGGAGFVGSHIAEYYAKKDWDITVFDNLSRSKLLNSETKNADFNAKFLQKNFPKIKLVQKDIVDFEELDAAAKGADVIFHAAAQTAVTASVKDPVADFKTNAIGSFNVMEAARKNDVKTVVYCSTNKVFGNNTDSIEVTEGEKRYNFGKGFEKGLPETFSIDLCEHTPYGTSKLTGDLYAQDYSHVYGIKTGVFRMSCIYGTRQFGVEDQGWVSWFSIATILGKPITIYGDGKQVRDVLYVSDLIELYDKFINSNVKHGVYNTGGGKENTMSLLELLEILKKLTGKESSLSFSDWRPSDQKVFIADISKAGHELGWAPKIKPEEGVQKLVDWAKENKDIF